MQMTMRYNYSDSEIKKLLKTMVVLIDTREQNNGHITQWLTEKKISYLPYNLDFGDYSVLIPSNPDYGISRDVYFDRQIILERKNSLEELSANLAQQRDRFNNEFLRAKDCKKFLVVERGSIDDILNGNYNTEFKPASYFASLTTFQHRYNLNISFVDRNNVAKFIYSQLYYFLREQLV